MKREGGMAIAFDFIQYMYVCLFARKRIQKDNVTFHPNNTVSYLEYRSYYFEPSMSAGNESDIVTIPNMLVLVSHYFLSLITHFNLPTILQFLLLICVFRVQQS